MKRRVSQCHAANSTRSPNYLINQQKQVSSVTLIVHIDGDDEIEIFYAFYVLVGWSFVSSFNSKKSYMYSSMASLSFSLYPEPMCRWNKEALKFMREELGNLEMGAAGMIKKLERSDICSPANPALGFLSQVQLQVVESKTTPAGQMNKVIDFLLQMEDKYFECFCKLLEQSNFGLQAQMLKEKAKDLKRSCGKFEYKQHTYMYSNITNTSCM